jgi:hypothetical protein
VSVVGFKLIFLEVGVTVSTNLLAGTEAVIVCL